MRGEHTLTSGGGAIWGSWCCWHAGTSKLLQVHVQPGRTEFVERRHHPCYNTKTKLKSRGMEERDIPPPAIIPSQNGRRCGCGRDGRDSGLSPRTMDRHQKTTGLASSWATTVCPGKGNSLTEFCLKREISTPCSRVKSPQSLARGAGGYYPSAGPGNGWGREN